MKKHISTLPNITQIKKAPNMQHFPENLFFPLFLYKSVTNVCVVML